MPRTARQTSSTGIYHVMLRGIGKQNIFEDDLDKKKFMQILAESKEKSGFLAIRVLSDEQPRPFTAEG